MKKLSMLFLTITLILLSFAKDGFTREDRERLIKLETTLNIFMQQTNRRFEELREDINKRFEMIDNRFEDINKRFEDINRSFEQLYTFLWIITGIFTSIMVATISFAYWERVLKNL